MKKYLYNYQTIIRFDAPVTRHFFRLRCMPCVNACQKASGRELFLYPSDYLTYGADAWGNPLQYGSRMDAHDSFVFVSSGEARLTAYRIPAPDGPQDVFRVQSPLTHPSAAMNCFMADAGNGTTALEQALDLAHHVYDYMRYTPGSTCADTSAADAFSLQQGVCQDYAHILLSLCRAKGIVARYVNGFLQGIGLTHAWVEVYDDGAWWGIDPTNNRFIEYGYIKLSHGRDAMDCPVNRGVFTGTARQQVEIRVIVEEI